MATFSAVERSAFDQAHETNNALLRQGGYLLTAEGVQGSHSTTTVRVQNGKVSLTDGPLVETQEQLIGVFFINARDLNGAIRLASQMPQARRGPIEVRPVVEFDLKE